MARHEERRLPASTLDADRETLLGLQALAEYAPQSEELSLKALLGLFERIQQERDDEIRAEKARRTRRQGLISLEWDLHNRLLRVRNHVRGWFGPDSDEVTLVGLKRTSDWRSPKRHP